MFTAIERAHNRSKIASLIYL